MKYFIHEDNMERLEKKLVRISNKCNRYGCEFHFEKLGEVYKDVKDEAGREYTAKFIEVEASGTAVLNGWRFIANIDHTPEGNIISGVGSVEIPKEYYTCRPHCDHCNSNRVRKYTSIVQNAETGEFKQVGRSCLADFTHGLSAETAAQFISWFDSIIEYETPEQGTSKIYFHRDKFLACSVEAVRCFGYIKRDDEYGRTSTAERSIDYYRYLHGEHFDNAYVRDEWEAHNIDVESAVVASKVEDMVNWISEQSADNEYYNNLKVICKDKYFNPRYCGMLASLVTAYHRAQKHSEEERRRRESRATSEFVGSIKDRITIDIISINCVGSYDTMYGCIRIYEMSDSDGNIYIWRTDKFIEPSEECEMKVVGTVKAHNVYKGVNQTELTRCRIS